MGRLFWMLRSDTRAMSRVLDVVWLVLNVTKAKWARLHTPIRVGYGIISENKCLYILCCNTTERYL